jgi:predicted transcriptional regulator
MAKGAARPRGIEDEPRYRRLIFGLPPELDDALRERADAEDRPLAWLVRRAIEQYLQSDAHSARVA